MYNRLIIPLFLALISTCTANAQFNIENAFPSLSFERPVDLQDPGDGSGRLFVLEQAGRILVFDNDTGVQQASVFLDIRDRVNDAGNEEGLLGLAFHPDYEQNGWFYVDYTADNPRRTVIARFSADATNPAIADPGSETVLLSFEQPYSNHNGGQLAFGPDGYLYIAAGDGGSGGDPQNNAQNRSRLLGKILRIDVDNTANGKEYGIPVDNPFAGNTEGYAEEIFSYGMRNPWRFSFDPLTGRLWAGDVGQNRFEEVDIIEIGKNYGWNIMEGFACYNPSSGCDTAGLTLPIIDYGRQQGASIIGGYVYRGTDVPELVGKYIYADFISGRIWALTYRGPGDVDNEVLLNSNQNISSFGVNAAGELYICTFSGAIFRFTPTTTSVGASGTDIPERASLSQSYPQPASKRMVSTVTLRFGIPAQQDIRIALYDTLGRELRTLAEGLYDAGMHRIQLNLSGLAPGVYLYALQTESRRITRKLLVTE